MGLVLKYAGTFVDGYTGANSEQWRHANTNSCGYNTSHAVPNS
jgi:hypothetical protein